MEDVWSGSDSPSSHGNKLRTPDTFEESSGEGAATPAREEADLGQFKVGVRSEEEDGDEALIERWFDSDILQQPQSTDSQSRVQDETYWETSVRVQQVSHEITYDATEATSPPLRYRRPVPFIDEEEEEFFDSTRLHPHIPQELLEESPDEALIDRWFETDIKKGTQDVTQQLEQISVVPPRRNELGRYSPKKRRSLDVVPEVSPPKEADEDTDTLVGSNIPLPASPVEEPELGGVQAETEEAGTFATLIPVPVETKPESSQAPPAEEPATSLAGVTPLPETDTAPQLAESKGTEKEGREGVQEFSQPLVMSCW